MDMLHSSVAAAAGAVKQYLQTESLPPLAAPVQIMWMVDRDLLPPWTTAHWPDVTLQTHEFYDPPSIKVFATWRNERFLLALLKSPGKAK